MPPKRLDCLKVNKLELDFKPNRVSAVAQKIKTI